MRIKISGLMAGAGLLVLPLLAAASAVQTFHLSSPAIGANGRIPFKYTCKASDQELSLPFAWQHAPKQTKSFAIVMSEPKSYPDPWYHYAIYNIASNVTQLDALADFAAQKRAVVVKNSWQHKGYEGPCPAFSEHYYKVEIYALNKTLRNTGLVDAPALLAAIDGHVLASATLRATFSERAQHS